VSQFILAPKKVLPTPEGATQVRARMATRVAKSKESMTREPTDMNASQPQATIQSMAAPMGRQGWGDKDGTARSRLTMSGRACIGVKMNWSNRYDGTEPQRVNKWLAQAGVCSRREAEALIADGLVSIDGQRVDDVGRKIAPGQTLTLTERGARQLGAQMTVVV